MMHQKVMRCSIVAAVCLTIGNLYCTLRLICTEKITYHQLSVLNERYSAERQVPGRWRASHLDFVELTSIRPVSSLTQQQLHPCIIIHPIIARVRKARKARDGTTIITAEIE